MFTGYRNNARSAQSTTTQERVNAGSSAKTTTFDNFPITTITNPIIISSIIQ